VHVSGAAAGEETRLTFDPRTIVGEIGELPPLGRPDFLPIVASETLATMLYRRAADGIAGFVVEGSRAGGHNAPPRGRPQFNDSGEPVYGPRDEVNLEAMRKLGLPFWLAGSYGSPEGLREALSAGAAGVQVGTAFALCHESGMLPAVRLALLQKALRGEGRVFTDPCASPTGFPFKVAQLEGTLSEAEVYEQRRRVCDLGFLREVYRRKDGSLGYRCPAEPEAAFLAKSGDPDATAGRKCLCNALVANIGMPQKLADGTEERCLITLGDDYAGVGRFCTPEDPDYSAADVIRVLLG
jgi:nitronate monooxygenase